MAAFDFTTPTMNNWDADYTSALFPPPQVGNRLPHNNVDFQVNYWISQGVPRSKINVGVAAYGRAWELTKESNVDGVPVVHNTYGQAPAGLETQRPGLLKYSEICALTSPSKMEGSGYEGESPLRRVVDDTHKYGVYAYRPADSRGEHGIWVSYEDTETVSTKGEYVKNRGLGGMALFDLSLDDFRGSCTGEKFPLLKAIKSKLS